MNVPEEATDNAHPVSSSIAVVEDTIDRATGDPRGPGYLPRTAESHPILLRHPRTLRRRRIVLRPAPTCFSVISFSLYMFARWSVNDKSTLLLSEYERDFYDHLNVTYVALATFKCQLLLDCENSKAKELL